MSNDFTYTKEVTGEIVQIPIGMLRHHPLNPRKELGDLTELAESIRAKGVMQNLTVVPDTIPEGATRWKYGYLVVIGNRRMEAAKIAGLETLPCIIAEMSEAEQVQTMLLENIQRSDLTVYEQAKGFQMMMQFGSTLDEVAEKTGFSKTSIRRRLKIADLDNSTLREVSQRQVSLADFDRLAEIFDLDAEDFKQDYNARYGKLADALGADENLIPKLLWTHIGGVGKDEKYYACSAGMMEAGMLPAYQPNQALNLIYDFLCDFGYELSDEEKAMKAGELPWFSAKKSQGGDDAFDGDEA